MIHFILNQTAQRGTDFSLGKFASQGKSELIFSVKEPMNVDSFMYKSTKFICFSMQCCTNALCQNITITGEKVLVPYLYMVLLV